MSKNIKTLQTIHLAICAGVIMAYLFTGNISQEIIKLPTIDSSNIVFLAIPLFAILISNLIFNFQVKQVNKSSNLEEKLAIYQTASILRWAILEGVAFALLFLKPDFLLLGILLILYLITLRPTEEKIKSTLP